MAIPYPADGAQFRDDLRAAGFVVSGSGERIDKIANALGCSKQHARNMLCGWNRYSKPMRAKMKELIDDNKEVASKSVVIEAINKEPDIEDVGSEETFLGKPLSYYTKHTNKKSQFNEPVDLPSNNKFAVIDATDGTAVIVEIIAPFKDHTMARKLCQKLNDENQ